MRNSESSSIAAKLPISVTPMSDSDRFRTVFHFTTSMFPTWTAYNLRDSQEPPRQNYGKVFCLLLCHLPRHIFSHSLILKSSHTHTARPGLSAVRPKNLKMDAVLCFIVNAVDSPTARAPDNVMLVADRCLL